MTITTKIIRRTATMMHYGMSRPEIMKSLVEMGFSAECAYLIIIAARSV